MTPLHHQIDVGKNSVATPRVSHFHRGINILDQKLGHVEYIYICYESMRLFAIQYGFMMAELSSPTIMGMISGSSDSTLCAGGAPSSAHRRAGATPAVAAAIDMPLPVERRAWRGGTNGLGFGWCNIYIYLQYNHPI